MESLEIEWDLLQLPFLVLLLLLDSSLEHDAVSEWLHFAISKISHSDSLLVRSHKYSIENPFHES